MYLLNDFYYIDSSVKLLKEIEEGKYENGISINIGKPNGQDFEIRLFLGVNRKYVAKFDLESLFLLKFFDGDFYKFSQSSAFEKRTPFSWKADTKIDLWTPKLKNITFIVHSHDYDVIDDTQFYFKVRFDIYL